MVDDKIAQDPFGRGTAESPATLGPSLELAGRKSPSEQSHQRVRSLPTQSVQAQEIDLVPALPNANRSHTGLRRWRSEMSKNSTRNSPNKQRSHSELGVRRPPLQKSSGNMKCQGDGAGNSFPSALYGTDADPVCLPTREVSLRIAQPIQQNTVAEPRQFEYQSRPRRPSDPSNPTGSGPSIQYVPSEKPISVVEIPQIKHPRLALETKSSSPLYTGGSTLEGEVAVTIDGGRFGKRYKDLPPLYIGRMTVNLVGVESWNGKHNIFQSLAVEALNTNIPPPGPVLASAKPSHGFWSVLPSLTNVPFQLALPVKVGPPPYLSKYASIRYILSATATVRVLGKESDVRDSCEIAILTVHNRKPLWSHCWHAADSRTADKDLINLPEPLSASDTITLSKTLPFEEAKLTALLHREVWASGMSLFVDLQISNRSQKFIKRINLSLERTVMLFYHTPAEISKGVQRHSRLPDRVVKRIATARITEKSKHGWHGIAPHAKDDRTWLLDIPPGLATIPTGKSLNCCQQHGCTRQLVLG